MTYRYRPSLSQPAARDPKRGSAGAASAPIRQAPPVRLAALAILATLGLAAAGCATISPDPLTLDQIEARAGDDRVQMAADQEPLPPVLTLEQVAARAIKYNLEHRQRLLEAAVQAGALDLGHYDLLPRLTASAGYLVRSNDAFAQQQQRGQPYNPDAPFTTSTERHRGIAAAEFGWNLLDFGVSYYRARVQADQVLVAEERKRKVVQNILQDVRAVYWRALGAQRLGPRVDDLIRRADAALANAREIEKTGLMPVPQALAYQRTLLDSITLLQSRRHEMELAQAELASLMNAGGQPFQLSDLAEEALPPAPLSLAELEELAMVSRPELREEDYRKRISAHEARRALVSTWPGLSLDLGWQYDGNRYLLHNDWAEGGLRVSLNLLRLAAIPAIQRQADAQARLDDARRLAQSMAILTQVRVAALGYGLARNDFLTFSRSADVDERMANYSRASADSRVESDLEVIRTEARAMLSEYQRHIAYANAQAAVGRLYHSVGLDIDADDASVPVNALAMQIRQSIRHWELATFGQKMSMPAAPPPVVALRLDGPVAVGERAAIVQAFAEVFGRHGLALVAEGEAGPAWTLVAQRPVPAPLLAQVPVQVPVQVPAPLAGLPPVADAGAEPAVTAAGATTAQASAAAAATGAGLPLGSPVPVWSILLMRPDGALAGQAAYQPPPVDEGSAFRRQGEIRGAAEASALLIRDLVRGRDAAAVTRP